MKRWIASFLLFGLGVAFIVHPLAHGLEDHPDACAVTQLSQQVPFLAVTPHLPTAPADGPAFVVVSFAEAAVTVFLRSAVSRGPPQA